MDDLLGQALATANIPSTASRIQPRPQTQTSPQNPGSQRVLVRQRPQGITDGTPSRGSQNIILVNGQVSNINGRTILIQNSNQPGRSTQRVVGDSPRPPVQVQRQVQPNRQMIRPIRVVPPQPNSPTVSRRILPINGGTPVQGQRIISRIPVSSSAGTPPNKRTIRVVRVDHGASGGPVRLQQVSNTMGQQPRRLIQTHNTPTNITPSRNIQNPARVTVQCHEPQGSRPGFIVLSSDSVDNLRSTFQQLQRCFSTCYTDIPQMDDDQHALIKKLKDIYRKSDTNYRNYLTKHPLKMLDNVKASFNGADFIPLEQFLRTCDDSQSQRNHVPIVKTTQNRSPSSNHRPIITRIHDSQNQSHSHNEVIKLPTGTQIKVEPTRKTPILNKIQQDQLKVTQMLEINEPFESIGDMKDRLLPFHCFTYPEISEKDDQLSEDAVLEPLSEKILQRKRNIEEQFRDRFMRDNQEMTFGEQFLIERLFTESEEAEAKEEREKVKIRRLQNKIPISRAANVVLSPHMVANGRPVMRMITIPTPTSVTVGKTANNNHNNHTIVRPPNHSTSTVQRVPFVNENESAVAGLLEDY